ncbi:hypothetical protein [Psychrobacter sp. Marseille-P5312]|uniref:hypothetical protein n=1 Tax=Psychrobacter sp. Marseille-P5312 TaxID=2086574 RepID=UPI000CF6CE83|nr:hypothetical protein [Psychrobacter sp. Marseille-P5312]
MGFLSGLLGAATGFLTGGPAGAVIGGVSGIMSDNEKDKAQKSADKANAASIALQQQQLASAKKREEDYDEFYKPIEDNYLAAVRKGVTPDYEQVTQDAIGDVETQFANSGAASLRSMQRLGINPNSGRADAIGRDLSLSKALAKVGTINNARRQESNRAEDLTFARQQDALTLGVNKLNNAQAASSSAATALSQTYADRAKQARYDGASAVNQWADLGSTVYQAWDQYKNKPAKTTVGTGVWM